MCEELCMLESISVSADFIESDGNGEKYAITDNESVVKSLKAGFSTFDARYQFEIRMDGSGMILYSDFYPESEEFFHEINLETLIEEIEQAVKSEINNRSDSEILEDSEIENIRQEVRKERLEEFFWDEVNPTLEDPFFRSLDDEDEWGAEFYCENGETAEFEEFLELCVLTERTITNSEDYLVIDSETDCEASGLSDCSYYTERLSELVEIACGYFKPLGHRYDYNDGWSDRYSGYGINSESITISLKEAYSAPAREKMLGMKKLREKLTRMNVPVDKIARLTAF